MMNKSKKRTANNSSQEGLGESSKAQTSRKKSRKPVQTTGKSQARDEVVSHEPMIWPEYFTELYKIFKALNTVLAFCSSRRHLAVTFPVVRSSVEAVIKRPLELHKVAELKALLPDLILFAYVLPEELRLNAESSTNKNRRNEYSIYSSLTTEKSRPSENNECVLFLDFTHNIGSGKTKESELLQKRVPSLSEVEVRKLIEKRNKRFEQAVAELLLVSKGTDDPVHLLQTAARDHIPVNPNATKSEDWSLSQPTSTIPNSSERDSIDQIIDEIKLSDWYREQIVDRRVFAEKSGRVGELAVPLTNTIVNALQKARNISSLYSHQVNAIDALQKKKNVIVSTSTASGKSIIYQLPMLRHLEKDREATAFYIYPTKALAQDQRTSFEQLLRICEDLRSVLVANYDGDTPIDERKGIRDTASIIFTNFDMLHASILPHEEDWRRFFQNLKLVAVDELHYYSGVFGTHVSYITRRLRRICAAVGNENVQFVSCSATIANPLQHMKNIFGVTDIEVVTDDGAPSGRKEFILWNPPPKDPVDPSFGRKSSLLEATGLMRYLMKKGVRTILFCKYRKMCELAMKSLRTDLTSEGRLDVLERVMAYRGGYSQQDRRKIENEAFSGNLLGLVATNALELGVDIGILDAVIILGFPFSIASLRQQAGRAGRRARDSLAVLVSDSLPLDQHYVQNPDDIFGKGVNETLIDLDDKVLLDVHLQCAAHELPLSEADEVYFGPNFRAVCDSKLVKDEDGWYHTNPKFLPYPSKHVSIRGIQEDTYTVIDYTSVMHRGGEPRILEEIEVSRAMFEAYEGAVFMHQGLTYIVQEISHDSKIAKLIRTDVNWTTKSRDFTDIDATRTLRIREIKGTDVRAFFGRIELKTIVFGFFKLRNNVILDSVDLEMPPFERRTTGFWVDIPKHTLELLRRKGFDPAEAIHSAEHGILNQFSMAADVRTECKVPIKEYMAADTKRKRPARLIFYDAAGTQGNIATKAFDHVSDLLHGAFETIHSCDCDSGCVKCIESSFCREGNIVSSKRGALIVIMGILNIHIDEDSIPDHDTAAADSIVEAEVVRTEGHVQLEPYADTTTHQIDNEVL